MDQAPLLSSRMGPNLRLISWGWCLPSPDETARWVGPLLLESKLGQDCSESWGMGRRRTWNTIGWHTTSFSPVSLPTPMQPSRQLVTQGASRLESRWGLQMLWQYSQRRNQVTLGGVENSDFNFTLAGPDVYLCLSTEQKIHKIFKRQCRASGYKECALP
jgi:hypothetical protein